MKENEQLVLDFIQTLQNRESSGDLARFYHKDALQIEFPNAITKSTATRNLEQMLTASEQGKKILAKETYEISRMFSSDDTVIIEAVWTGTLAIAIGNIKPGGEMKAYFAQIFEFKDGKIFRQRNYDCFEPFN